MRVQPASESGPCSACPWRTSNQGKRHPDGWYTKKNLRRLWAGLRRGERMTCHPTDPTNPLPEGSRAVPEGTTTRECTGGLIVIQREMQRLNDSYVAGGSYGDYHALHPRGLTRIGGARHALDFAIVLPGELRMATPDLNTPDVGHPDLVPWENRDA